MESAPAPAGLKAGTSMKRGRNGRLLITAAMLWLASGLHAMTASAAEPVNDVRILIDISGSMKHNDPHNLRAPALRLLTGLLPEGAQAGVWTYGQYVNMLVPNGAVDPAWQARARKAADQINSFGLFTNIEGALKDATRDWTAPDPARRRSLIMLTDGFVDIAKDKALNAAARDRIINTLLPRLRDAKVKIYTIALSDQADHALLRQLSAATDGWSEEAEDADQLQRIFLHLFEKATHPDTLPLQANRVQVDSSIREVTFLVFRDPGGKSTELEDPQGHRFGSGKPPPGVRWHGDTGYDLITITQPQPGTWRVLGPEDADNRVMVVTNLKLRTTQLPNNLSVDDTPYFFVQLLQGDKVIQRKAFLDLVKITLHQQQPGQQWDWQLHDDGQGPDLAAGDGTFSLKLAASQKEGRHELTLRVDGTTFQREQRQVINVYAYPAQATITPDAAVPGHYVLSVIPYAGLIEPDTMTVSAVITDAKGAGKSITLARSGPAEWRAELSDYKDPAGYDAEFTVTGTHAGGKPVHSQLGPFHFTPAGTAVIDKLPQTVPETPEATPAPAPKANPPEPEAQKIDWFTVAWQTLLINAVLIGAGVFAYRRWRKSPGPAVASVEEAQA
jgi:uncharacterized protein (TIGR03503 family)